MRTVALVLALVCAVGGAVIGGASASGTVEGIPQLPPRPTVYRVAPQTGCKGTAARPRPPRPGLRATALSRRQVRLDWWFNSLPASCRPSAVYLAIDAFGDPKSSAWNIPVPVRGLSGRKVITYPSIYPATPDIAFAAATMPYGGRSDFARVLIRR